MEEIRHKIIIYGAGNSGRIAAHFVGLSRVECFIDNNPCGQYLWETEIISIEEYVKRYNSDNCIVIIASEKYGKEMSESAIIHGVKRYFMFRENDVAGIESEYLPRYSLYKKWHTKTYDEVLAAYDLSEYKSIGIYGVNYYLPYLLIELNERGKLKQCTILTDDGLINEEISTLGVPVGKLDEYGESIDCLIVNVKRKESRIHEMLFSKDYVFDVIDIYAIDKLVPRFYYAELEKYKEIHKGKRVFLVGNGPSLKIDDLETLSRNKEICFGCNKVYRVYDKTAWRADYLCMCDHRTINACADDIGSIDGTVFLGDTYHTNKVPKFEQIQYVHLFGEEFAPQMPGFSSDITYGVYMGWNIVYDMMIQIAAYMGFSEIYLLGVDHQLNDNPMENGNHFIDNYFNDEEKRAHRFDKNAFDMESKSLGFKKAEAYSRKHGFRIYNATRGGKLEVFERVDFDALFQ